MTYVKTLLELGLLFVDYTQAKIDFVRLVESRGHAHHLGEGLFGVIERTVAVVEDADTVPKLGLLYTIQSQAHLPVRGRVSHLWILEVVESRLVCSICFLQLVHHEITMTWKELDI